MIIETGAVLRAHEYMRIERPPLLWNLSVDPEPFFRLLGEMISYGLTRGNELGELTLKADNITVGLDGPPHPGDYVGITILGTGGWAPEQTWPLDTGSEDSFVTPDLHEAAIGADLHLQQGPRPRQRIRHGILPCVSRLGLGRPTLLSGPDRLAGRAPGPSPLVRSQATAWPRHGCRRGGTP